MEIAFLEGPVTRLFSIKNKETRKMAWVHNDVSLVFGNGIKAKLKKYLDRKTYTKYEKLIFVSKDNLEKFKSTYKEKKKKKEIIYNYINKENIINKSERQQEISFNLNTTNFVTVARLVPQKGIDRIINIHNRLIKEGIKHHFYVIGDGPEKQKLQTMIEKYQIENTFYLLGKKENPYPYIKNADYFCLLSHFEGYGMVLEEAKILNKPIIITDTAARETVEKYKKSKILGNTTEEIYQGLKKILLDKTLEVKENLEEVEYDNHQILKQVIELIEK